MWWYLSCSMVKVKNIKKNSSAPTGCFSKIITATIMKHSVSTVYDLFSGYTEKNNNKKHLAAFGHCLQTVSVAGLLTDTCTKGTIYKLA